MQVVGSQSTKKMKKDEATTPVISRGGLEEKVPAAHFTIYTTPHYTMHTALNKSVGVVHLAASTSKTSKVFHRPLLSATGTFFFSAVDSPDLFISFSDVSLAKPIQ